ncbi:MAG: spermidine/putrescine ABC transporter substrate-binding protein [Desulfuromonas sp.]|nr:MAG: spermidine/putrescine ABC transporter substrate-binding protein [Desulfuromonas sp.]
MRTYLLIILVVLLVSPVFAAQPPRELTILNWDDYLDPELVTRFERENNAKVSQVLYATDEDRTRKLLETGGRGYDLILTSGIDLAKYIKNGWLKPLDTARLKNRRHLSSQWLTAFPDAEQYALPYFWGTLGIAYRTDLVKTPITRWSQIFTPAQELHQKIGMIDDSRDIVSMALKALGFSANSEDKEALAQVKTLLRQQKPHVKSYRYVAIDETSALLSGEMVAAMMYNGDALAVAEFNENITYVLPEEGGNIWVDYFVLSHAARNPDLAYAFLDFINNPPVAAQQAEYVYFATPNAAAEKLLDPEFLEHPAIYPSVKALKQSEYYQPISPRGNRLRNIMSSEILR